MDINDKQLMDLASQLGFSTNEDTRSSRSNQNSSPKISKADRMSDLADQYKGKSDQELIDEILKVKQSLKKDRAQFEKQLKTVKALRSMMNNDQKARLDKLLRILEADD
jgi:hypothetical protein